MHDMDKMLLVLACFASDVEWPVAREGTIVSQDGSGLT